MDIRYFYQYNSFDLSDEYIRELYFEYIRELYFFR